MTLTRRQFMLSLASLGGATSLADFLAGRAPLAGVCSCAEGPTANGSFLFDQDNWKRHGMAHFVDQFWPGDHGCLAFDGDESPFDGRLPQAAPGDDPPDPSPGAYAACAINALWDPYYDYEQQNANFAVVAGLDWQVRLYGCQYSYLYHTAPWSQQIRAANASQDGLLAEAWNGAWLLTMATALGAAYNYAVTNDIGWPGPSDHYYHGTAEGSHVGENWLRPEQDAAAGGGNLP